MRRPSITWRLALLFGVVSAVSFLALGIYLSSALEMHFAHMDRDRLMATAARIERSIDQSIEQSGGTENIHERLDALMAGHDRVSMWIRREDGEPLVVDAPMAFPEKQAAPLFAASGAITPTLFTWEDQGQPYRGLALRHHSGDKPPLDVVIAFSVEHHRYFMRLFRHAMWIAVTGAIAATILLGVLVSRSSMRPMRRLTALAQRVSTNRLGERLDTDDVPQELIELATAFNDMLARLDDSFRRLSNFSSDIAHELRTPVSNLLTETQVTLSRERDVANYRDVLASNAEELERLSRMVSDMLFIAKADNGLVLPQCEIVDLGRQVDEVFEFFDALAEEKSVTMTRTGAAVVSGDRLMLRRALSNLLSNALLYTPQGGRIEVALASDEAETVSVSVSNTGTPLADDECARLFDRFYRTDPARKRSSDGAGLGLAITKSIVAAHGGRIEARATHDGNMFAITLPVSRDGNRRSV